MSGSAKRSITVSLDGSNKSSSLPLIDGTIGPPVADIRKLYGDLGIFTYDPGYGATASCESKITYIDGDEGVLLYRGYPIEQLAEKSNFLEICYLLLNGDLPNAEAARGVRTRRHAAHHAARADPPVLQRLPPRRASDGGDVRRGRRAVGVLSRQPRHPRSGEPAHQRVPADRQGADDRRLGATNIRSASRSSIRATTSPTRRISCTCSTPCRRSHTRSTRCCRARWT